MARRGRFTSPNSGGQNLTALITSLLRERNSAEEQALLNAYRTGTAYNGAVPTADDIQAFYDNWASSSGYSQGSLEYQAIFQKKSELNNYDIKKQYNSLLNDFNENNGANYDELLDFLDNRAVDSTDPQDIESYASAVSDINKSYIAYQGEALGRGEITAAEYRNLTNDIVSQMDPSDPKRYETLVNSYTYEWNAEKTKWDNRLTAGTVTAGQYSNWAKGFQTALLAAGIKKDSVLYTTAVAAQAVAQNRGGGGGGAGSVVKTRIDGTLAEVDAIVDVALSIRSGADVQSIEEINATGKDSLKELINDPALILNLGEALDQNPSLFPALARLGITDSTGLNNYFQDKLKSGLSDANLLAATGGPDYRSSWYQTNDSVGALSELARFDFQSTKWLSDVAAARGNIAKIEELNREWEKYLTPGGAVSKYGKLDASKLPDSFLTLAQNELNAMRGVSDGSQPTLTATVNKDLPINFTTVTANTAEMDAMKNGRGFQQWDDEKGEFAFVEGTPSGQVQSGSYQFIEFGRVDGKIVSYVTSVKGAKVSNSAGEQIGWSYDRKNGSPFLFTNMDGELLDLPLGGVNGNQDSGFTLPEGSTFTTSETKLPLWDGTGLATQKPITFGANSRNELALIRSGIVQTESTVSTDDLREAAGTVEKVLPALGGNRLGGEGVADDIVSTADKIQIAKMADNTSPKSKAETARLSGNTELEKAWLFIDANKNKLEVVNGGYRWKAGTPEASGQGTNPFGSAAAGAGLGAIAGASAGGVGAIPGAVLGGIGGFAQGALNYRQSPSDQINDINRQILNNDPTMFAQRRQFYYSTPVLSPTGSTAAPELGDRFFRKINPPAIPSTPGIRPGIPDVAVVAPRPAIPAPVVRSVDPMTQKYGSMALNTTTPILQSPSTERRGGK
jgi:hypothetical protein